MQYFYYDDPANGDLHMVVPGKFLAFRGPRDAVDGRNSLQPADYVEVFKVLNVDSIVRLNKAEYRKSAFMQSGFEHHDLVFDDCSVPPKHIIDSFLRLAEEKDTGQVIAVHCLAGLGRTGTLIGLYMMKHYGFTANETMGWLRVCRPGSIIGPQQQFLADQEARMHQLGAMGASGLALGTKEEEMMQSNSPSNYNQRTGLAQAKVLAEMVTDGMLNRQAARVSEATRKSENATGEDGKQRRSVNTRSSLPWLGQKDQGGRKHSLPTVRPTAGKRLGGGMTRSNSHQSLQTSGNDQPVPANKRSHGAMDQLSPGKAGLGGLNSLRKTGSFNNMSNLVSSALLSSASSSSSDDQHDSDSDEVGFEAGRSMSDDLQGPGSGSLCFGGMQRLHRNVPPHLLQSLAGHEPIVPTSSAPASPEGGTQREETAAAKRTQTGRRSSLFSFFNTGVPV